ncbi:hypothetical protein BLNAU_6348 [Blattamonas nauphoetae]|uniref:FHA domain-containing protein n=1 Tax=Blattamonas nauphoetae TaxID=2049346 RepID=A0ABQ9Y4E4_9EUKA|nr:hypothetical protein BLNAU_6348 [Blattamonas nauphoetae]
MSRNGTFVNEERVWNSKKKIEHGDVLKFGYDLNSFRFEYTNPTSIARGLQNLQDDPFSSPFSSGESDGRSRSRSRSPTRQKLDPAALPAAGAPSSELEERQKRDQLYGRNSFQINPFLQKQAQQMEPESMNTVSTTTMRERRQNKLAHTLTPGEWQREKYATQSTNKTMNTTTGSRAEHHRRENQKIARTMTPQDFNAQQRSRSRSRTPPNHRNESNYHSSSRQDKVQSHQFEDTRHHSSPQYHHSSPHHSSSQHRPLLSDDDEEEDQPRQSFSDSQRGVFVHPPLSIQPSHSVEPSTPKEALASTPLPPPAAQPITTDSHRHRRSHRHRHSSSSSRSRSSSSSSSRHRHRHKSRKTREPPQKSQKIPTPSMTTNATVPPFPQNHVSGFSRHFEDSRTRATEAEVELARIKAEMDTRKDIELLNLKKQMAENEAKNAIRTQVALRSNREGGSGGGRGGSGRGQLGGVYLTGDADPTISMIINKRNSFGQPRHKSKPSKSTPLPPPPPQRPMSTTLPQPSSSLTPAQTLHTLASNFFDRVKSVSQALEDRRMKEGWTEPPDAGMDDELDEDREFLGLAIERVSKAINEIDKWDVSAPDGRKLTPAEKEEKRIKELEEQQRLFWEQIKQDENDAAQFEAENAEKARQIEFLQSENSRLERECMARGINPSTSPSSQMTVTQPPETITAEELLILRNDLEQQIKHKNGVIHALKEQALGLKCLNESLDATISEDERRMIEYDQNKAGLKKNLCDEIQNLRAANDALRSHLFDNVLGWSEAFRESERLKGRVDGFGQMNVGREEDRQIMERQLAQRLHRLNTVLHSATNGRLSSVDKLLEVAKAQGEGFQQTQQRIRDAATQIGAWMNPDQKKKAGTELIKLMREEEEERSQNERREQEDLQTIRRLRDERQKLERELDDLNRMKRSNQAQTTRNGRTTRNDADKETDLQIQLNTALKGQTVTDKQRIIKILEKEQRTRQPASQRDPGLPNINKTVDTYSTPNPDEDPPEISPYSVPQQPTIIPPPVSDHKLEDAQHQVPKYGSFGGQQAQTTETRGDSQPQDFQVFLEQRRESRNDETGGIDADDLRAEIEERRKDEAAMNERMRILVNGEKKKKESSQPRIPLKEKIAQANQEQKEDVPVKQELKRPETNQDRNETETLHSIRSNQTNHTQESNRSHRSHHSHHSHHSHRSHQSHKSAKDQPPPSSSSHHSHRSSHSRRSSNSQEPATLPPEERHPTSAEKSPENSRVAEAEAKKSGPEDDAAQQNQPDIEETGSGQGKESEEPEINRTDPEDGDADTTIQQNSREAAESSDEKKSPDDSRQNEPEKKEDDTPQIQEQQKESASKEEVVDPKPKEESKPQDDPKPVPLPADNLETQSVRSTTTKKTRQSQFTQPTVRSVQSKQSAVEKNREAMDDRMRKREEERQRKLDEERQRKEEAGKQVEEQRIREELEAQIREEMEAKYQPAQPTKLPRSGSQASVASSPLSHGQSPGKEKNLELLKKFDTLSDEWTRTKSKIDSNLEPEEPVFETKLVPTVRTMTTDKLSGLTHTTALLNQLQNRSESPNRTFSSSLSSTLPQTAPGRNISPSRKAYDEQIRNEHLRNRKMSP